jgi:LuxR family transcriptional regulator, maltose regulon positive regulatory protein
MNRAKNSALQGTEYVLHTKLMPPRLRTTAIGRENLVKRLNGGLNGRLILLSAPTGFGKTTLVSTWIASRDFASAWVTLDENDNDPSRFWTYLVSALRTFDALIGKTTLSTLNAPQLPSFHTLLTPLLNDLARLTGPHVLVLDDFHSITSKEINDSLSFLIQNLPDALCLVMLTRSQPDLPLPLLRARNELLEIDTQDLRLNAQETASFLQVSTQAEIPAAAMESLFQKTEGWAAGLQLAALSLENRNPVQIQEFIESFSGSHRYISDYLIKEVFEDQSEPVQTFLMRTCFLKSLTASLGDAVAGINNSAALLETLERDNLFLVRLDQGRGQPWYRYSPLFAESIQFLARQRLDQTAIQSLFERASNWYEYHGLLEDAIETALNADLFERAMSLIEKYLEIHDLREARTLNRWLAVIPQNITLGHPVISFTFAQIILYSEDRFASATAAKIEPYLGAAESTWRSGENLTGLGQVHSFRGNVAWWQGDLQKSFEYARRSMGELPESEVFWRGNSLLTLGYEALNDGRILDAQDIVLEARALLGAAQNVYGVLAAIQLLGEIFYLQGDLEQAQQLDEQILADAVGDVSMLDDQGIASLSLANIAYERNELDQADVFARRALDLGMQRSNEMLQVQSTICLARICSAWGDMGDAHELLKTMEARIQNPVLLPEIQNTHVLFFIQENHISSLDWWIKLVSEDSRKVSHSQSEREAFILARLRIAEGKFREALDILEPWKQEFAENGRTRSQVESSLLEALAYQADSDFDRALPALVRALTLGQSKGFRRLFLDEGMRLAALLQMALPSLPNRPLSLFAGTLLHSFPAESTARLTATGSTVLIEPLSQQELRVLRLLVAGRSNAEIASELVVSNNTVKTHVKSIYRKLNVKSREEAREMVRELKLL